MPFAIIDLGTNTFNLLVFERDGAGLRILHSSELPVFLGARDAQGGGIEAGSISGEAFARGLEALRMHKASAQRWEAQRIAGYGTSALRNARNAPDFVRRAWEEFSIPITIIPGEEEAGLILDGVRQAVSFGAKPALVMDIGGGSTEFILATEKALMWKRSFELGVTRLRERFAVGDPMTLEEESRIAAHLDAQLEPLWAIIDRHAPQLLIGSAGSFDTLAAIIAHERGIKLTPSLTTLQFTAHEFDRMKDRMMRLTRAERLLVPGLPPHRVDTVCFALIQIERVLVAGGIRELAWSRYALKEGAALRVA